MTWVSTEPVREHVQALRAEGLGTRRIAALAGRPRITVESVFRTRRMAADNAAAILAVTVAPRLPADQVEAHGVRRRGHGLAALGWSFYVQARIAGVHEGQYRRALARPTVEPATRDRHAAVYDKLSMEIPEGRSANWVRIGARRSGFFPPLAWDEETIDDPDALPCLLPPVEPVDRDLELLVQRVFAGHSVEATIEAKREIVRRMPDRRAKDVAPFARCSPQRVSQIRSWLEAS